MTTPFFYQPYGASTATPIDILIGSASGISADTSEIQTAYNSIYVGEVVSRITHSKRPVSFRIPVSASSMSALNTAIREYSAIFCPSEHPAKFIVEMNTPSRYLSVYPSGSPSVDYQSDTVAFLTVNLVAPNPYWYSSATPIEYDSGDTIVNSGLFPAPVSFTIDDDADEVVLTAGDVGRTIGSRGEESIAGITVTVTDSEVRAESDGENQIDKFDISSQWFMIPVGESVITGASGITINQRWSTP